PQRVAIISSPTAAGYGDFMNQLENNAQHYCFKTQLFPALMQGNGAAESIMAALEQVSTLSHLFDVVVIIRGGGATTDLSCYDNYELCLACACMELPVITGIGHQRDRSVLDIVAHTSVKTPTAAAELLIQMLTNEEQGINNLQQLLLQSMLQVNGREQHRITQIVMRIQQAVKRTNQRETDHIDMLRTSIIKQFAKHSAEEQIRFRSCLMQIGQQSARFVAEQEARLQLMQRSIELQSPQRILNMGYTITLLNGRPVTSVRHISEGQTLKTEFADGSISSVVRTES
ncbi:MAG: exodeoxyribonuclease VII large subunit, partial [Paludibacteraceae bacterium]|nr:exodeoxyribonuclease VII large subunit [Paludibacteraceae bacterium]